MRIIIKLALACLMVGLGYFIANSAHRDAYNEGYNKGAHDQDSIHSMTEGWIQGGEIKPTCLTKQ